LLLCQNFHLSVGGGVTSLIQISGSIFTVIESFDSSTGI